MMFTELSERITGNVKHDLDIIIEKALEEIRRLKGSVK